MPSAGNRRRRRIILRIAVAIALLGVVAAALFLRGAGRYLVVEQALERSDAIVVLGGARVERWLEAVDLYRAGWARHIVLSPGRIELAELRLRQSGVRFPAEAELVRDTMVQMKVPADAVVILPASLDNTAEEATSARQAATAAGWHRLIVVTSKYHTRRTLFAFEREFRGTSIEIRVRGTRYESAMPDRWWTSRADFRWVTSELQKLLAYRLGLGE
jgi:uncharacterized SAM-binding protein YcdF (DUF218 family)